MRTLTIGVARPFPVRYLKVRMSINIRRDAQTLDRLTPGVHGVVASVVDVDATVLRLFEMGLTDGAPVVVTRRAPLGGAIEIEVRGTRVCLRRDHARRFVVNVA